MENYFYHSNAYIKWPYICTCYYLRQLCLSVFFGAKAIPVLCVSLCVPCEEATMPSCEAIVVSSGVHHQELISQLERSTLWGAWARFPRHSGDTQCD